MHRDRWTRILSVTALLVALVALAVAGRATVLETRHRRDMEELGELIRRSASAGRPIMDMGPPGGGLPDLDRGE